VIRALLALTIAWLPVVEDCLGLPEGEVVYEVSYLWRECRDVWTETPTCDVFAVKVLTESTEWTTVIGNEPPQVGAGYWYQVRARDGAGNWSDSCQ
jgi:hypothetical protein